MTPWIEWRRSFSLDAVGPQRRPWIWASGHGQIKRAAQHARGGNGGVRQELPTEVSHSPASQNPPAPTGVANEYTQPGGDDRAEPCYRTVSVALRHDRARCDQFCERVYLRGC